MGALSRVWGVVAGLCVLGLASAPARAQSAPPPDLECRLTVSAAAVKLGEPVTCTVTLVNRGAVPVKIVMPDFDFHSVSLRLQWLEPLPPVPKDPGETKDGEPDGEEGEKKPGEEKRDEKQDEKQDEKPAEPPTHREREVRLERHTPTIVRPRPLDERTLPPGESLACEILVPMIFPGPVRITALYYGYGLSKALPLPVSGQPLPSPAVTVTVAPTPKNQLGATLETPFGPIEVELFPSLAPNHVFNFLWLARTKFFDDSFVPRINDQVVQAGSPEPHTAGTPGFTIPPEFNDRKHVRGMLSMARSQHPFTAGSQFFICRTTLPHLDLEATQGMGYTIFGQVIAGQEAFAKLESVETQVGPTGEKSQPVEELKIRTITPFAR